MKLIHTIPLVACLAIGCAGGLRQTRIVVDESQLGEIAWGQPTNGLQAGIEVTMPEDRFVFTGHLKNASDKPIRIVDPQISGKTWGVVASGLEERIADKSSGEISPAGLPETAVITLAPGQQVSVSLRYQMDADLVPYSASLRYVYVNQAQSLLDSSGRPLTDMWIGRIASRDVSVQTDFKNSKVTKVTRG